jgi:hypothetical protein
MVMIPSTREVLDIPPPAQAMLEKGFVLAMSANIAISDLWQALCHSAERS